jgi:hypothetical protein
MTATAQPGNTGQLLVRNKCGTEHVAMPVGKFGRDFPEIFQRIRVMDARPDTTRIGIVRVGRVMQDEVRFHASAGEQLTNYLNAAYTKPSGRYSLLIVLKDLWISTPDSFEARVHNEWNLRFRVEAYLTGKNGYCPLTRIDSTLIGIRGLVASEVAQARLRDLFDVFMDKVATVDFDKDRKSVTFEQIDSFNRSRFAYPMDTATQYTKGVYATVEDFWNNSPSVFNYTIDKDPSGNSELNIPDETGKLYFNHTVWGYCDGSQPYVMMDGNLFPVFNIGHQFYVMGSKEYRKRDYRMGYSMGIIPLTAIAGTYLAVSATAAIDVKGNTSRTLRIFRIDPATGKVTE